MKHRKTRVGKILELLDPKHKQEQDTETRRQFVKEIDLRQLRLGELLNDLASSKPRKG